MSIQYRGSDCSRLWKSVITKYGRCKQFDPRKEFLKKSFEVKVFELIDRTLINSIFGTVFSRNFKSPENEGYSYRLTLTLAYNESDRTFGRQHTTRDFSIYLDKQGKSSAIRFDRI